MRSKLRACACGWLASARWPMQVLVALLLAATVAAQDRPADPFLQGQGTLKVMTWNMYTGTGYSGIPTAANRDAVFQAVTNALNEVRAGDPPARAQAIAQQIAAAKPDLVSLQEVSTWSTGTYTGTWTKDTICENLNLEFDYRQLLLDALAALGAHYTPVATNTHVQVKVPMSQGECWSNTWSVVVLARADLKPEDFSYSNVDARSFVNVVTISIPALGYSQDWPRGWISVDVNYRGKQLRLIAAHLDSLSRSKNIAQGLELLNGPAKTALPVIAAGDMNTPDPTGPTTYNNFINAGFEDSWYATRNQFDSGYSGYTKPYPSPMNQRGDLVFVRGPFQVQAAAVLCGGSDHCGVVARLQLPDTN